MTTTKKQKPTDTVPVVETKTKKTNELDTEATLEALLYVLHGAPDYVRVALKQFMAALALWTLKGDAPAMARIKREYDTRNAATPRNGGAK
jgi:hypothetical protein